MAWWRDTVSSTIGMKWIMGVTGVLLFVFVAAHMLGNLQIYLGRDVLNQYGENFRHMPVLLWTMRLGLLGTFIVHIVSAVRLTQLNRAARPVAYAVTTPQVSSYASRTMFMSGLIILAFLAYHLAHFTFGVTHPQQFALHDAHGRHDVYAMVVLAFRQPLIGGLYIVAMIPLMVHLQHGVSSFFQTLGFNHPKYNRLCRAAGPVCSMIIFAGNCSIPLAVLMGMLR